MKKTILLTILLILTIYPDDSKAKREDYGFRFVRISYDMGSYGGRGRRGFGEPPWRHDYPTSEENFYDALERTSEIKIAGKYLVLSLKDERIFEYPFLYLCEPGYWTMNQEELENVREYFARGGFMLFDDFRGRDWYNFEYQILQIFPDRRMELLPPDHKIWSIYYDIDPIEAPSKERGYGKYDDEYYGMFDDDGRLMFVVCYNQDIGDGWEWPNQNYQDVSTISFQMGINFVIYALTH